MKLSEYITKEWALYGTKSNIRGLPSLCDGLTKTTRKLVWFLQNDDKFETVERLGLKAAERGHYQHGGSSITGALTNMVKSFPGYNNAPLFEGEGQFGNEVDNDASAARYVSCRIGENFKHWFSKKDNAVLEKVIQRGDVLEPIVMAPIAPLVFVNGAAGIGNGYSCSIPQFLPEDVVRATLETLEFGFVETALVPNWTGWKGKVEQDPTKDTRFIPKGTFKRLDSSTILIDCLPPSYDGSKYEKQVLIPLIESGQIVNFDNESNEFEGWNIFVKFKRGVAGRLSDTELEDLLKVRDTKNPINTNLTLWNSEGNITKYIYVEEAIESWVEWRIEVYETRRLHEINKLEEDLYFAEAKLYMINYFLRLESLPKKDQVRNYILDGNKLLTEKQLEKLLNTPVGSISEESADSIVQLISKLRVEQHELSILTAKQYMINEVNELKQYYEGK